MVVECTVRYRVFLDADAVGGDNLIARFAGQAEVVSREEVPAGFAIGLAAFSSGYETHSN